MRSPGSMGAAEEGGGGAVFAKREMAVRILTRCCCIVFLSLWASFVLSFVLGFVAIAMGGFSSSNPVVVPSFCRILSSSVDVKFSRVCDLGFLNYKARNIFYPSKRARFRCHDDYYWASVFQVEYKEHFSGQILHAVAEAPKEALPQECRPGFGTAWMTKMKFKVNATYHCKYTLGSHKADIYPDNLFNCQGKDPSRTEMVRRFCILFTRSVAEGWRSGTWMGYAITGIVLGMLSSICCVIVIRILQAVFLSISRKLHAKKCLMPIAFVRLRRACLLVAYVCAVVWLLLLYRKVIGLKQLSFNSSLREI